jgi:hypothetical protein
MIDDVARMMLNVYAKTIVPSNNDENVKKTHKNKNSSSP